MAVNLEEFEYDDDGVKGFYERFEMPLEKGRIAAGEECFMPEFGGDD